MQTFTFKVTVRVDESTPTTEKEIARMITEDIGSWQGSLPTSERLWISDVDVKDLENNNLGG